VGIEGQGWHERGRGTDYGRLPAKAEGKVPEAVWNLGRHTAGFCLRFCTDASTLHVRWELAGEPLAMVHMPATGVSGVDLYGLQEDRWRFLRIGPPGGMANMAAFEGLPPAQEFLLYFPLYNGVRRLEIGLPAGAGLTRVRYAQEIKPLAFYGTSITQGGCASRPGMAYTAIVGRALDLPVINLGFSGNGRMEPALAQLLAELEASVYVLDAIANMDPAMVQERVAPFVLTLRAAHPQTPILLAEDASPQEAIPTPKGRLLRRVYRSLLREGVPGLHFLSGRGMRGRDGEATVDGGHPTDLGMMRQAQVFIRALQRLV